MIRHIYLLLFTLFVVSKASTQDYAKYKTLIGEAYKLYQQEEFLQSAQKYSEAFIAFGNKGMVTDRYNAACSWALANETDSAFVQLFKIANNGNYTNHSHLTKDPDFKSLYGDERWEEVKILVMESKMKAEENLDKPLVAVLDKILDEDQKYRMQDEEIEKKYGRKSEELKALWKTINEKDSANLVAVKEILDERGWLGPDIIGKQGNQTLFLVIQHSDLETQVKYLPMMREAAEKGDARPSSLALLEDRVALGQGKKQIYGSQIHRDKKGEHYVAPMIDPENVDERRAKVGLGPIADYVSRWDIIWDVTKHKERTEKIESRKKERGGVQ